MNAVASKQEDLTESADDSAESPMTYDKTSSLPLYVVAVWALALIGLGGYFLAYYITDLQRWSAL